MYRFVIILTGCLVLLLSNRSFVLSCQDNPPVAAADEDIQFMRMKTIDDHLVIQTSLHTYQRPDEPIPKITLISTIHVGEKEYYQTINQLFKSVDMVLFEAPGSPRFMKVLKLDNESRKERAESAANYIAQKLDEYALRHDGKYPDKLAKLVDVESVLSRKVRIKRAIGNDGWNRAWSYQADGNQYMLSGLGADGVAGGGGVNADISRQKTSKFEKRELLEFEKVMDQRVDALIKNTAWEYQTQHLDFSDEAKFILSDIDEIDIKTYRGPGAPRRGGQRRRPPRSSYFKASLPGHQLESLLVVLMTITESSAAGLVSGLLPTFWQDDDAATQVDDSKEDDDDEKIRQREIEREVYIRTVGRSIERMSKRIKAMKQAGNAAEAFRMMVGGRNDKVIEDLEWILAQDKQPKHIAIIYGAAHMPDFDIRLRTEFGYKRVKTNWLTAMQADLEKTAVQLDR